MNLKVSLTLIAGSFLLSSCGILFGGTRYRASIIAKDHPKAQIYVDGSYVGRGTGIGLFSRHRKLNVELREEGCEPYKRTFGKTFRTGNFILSALTWGLVGIGVDLASGASFKPNHNKDPDIMKLTEKDFSFIVEYPGCEINKYNLPLIDR